MSISSCVRCLAVPAAVILALVSVTVASAHVSVGPAYSSPGAFEHYTVYVPAEKPGIASVGLRLLIPPGVVVAAVAAAPGWRISVEKKAGRITALSWSGGVIPFEQYAAFGFAARNPPEVATLTWRALQMYQDGSAVAWAGPPGAQEPAPVTVLRAAATGSTAGAPAPPSTLAFVALAFGAVGLVCALSTLAVLLVVLRHRLLS